jgi:hypothetical protein
MTAAALIQRYAQNLVETGGTPHHWISVDAALTQAQANDLQQQWVETRTRMLVSRRCCRVVRR